MKKEKLIWPITIIIIFLIIAITFYLISMNNTGKNINEKITTISENSLPYFYQNKATSTNTTFSKKIECEKYRNEIEEKIKQYNLSQKPEVKDSSVPLNPEEPINHLYLKNNELKEIFYSPKVDSCVYIESRKDLIKSDPNANPNIGTWGISFESYYMIDALTNEEINFNNGLPFIDLIHRSEIFTTEKNAEKIINEYK